MPAKQHRKKYIKKKKNPISIDAWKGWGQSLDFQPTQDNESSQYKPQSPAPNSSHH